MEAALWRADLSAGVLTAVVRVLMVHFLTSVVGRPEAVDQIRLPQLNSPLLAYYQFMQKLRASRIGNLSSFNYDYLWQLRAPLLRSALTVIATPSTDGIGKQVRQSRFRIT
eukprot:4518813-Pleurochrysis_carterae.AAC.3